MHLNDLYRILQSNINKAGSGLLQRFFLHFLLPFWLHSNHRWKLHLLFLVEKSFPKNIFNGHSVCKTYSAYTYKPRVAPKARISEILCVASLFFTAFAEKGTCKY